MTTATVSDHAVDTFTQCSVKMWCHWQVWRWHW